jgi:hypothetical protein
MLVQYGPPAMHGTKEATSRFVSPVSMGHFFDHQCTHTFLPQIFNHLIAVFGFAFRNRPESIIKECFTGVEYYLTGTTINSAVLLFIEVNLKSYGPIEHLDAIAQVIAECNGQAYFLLLNFKLRLIIF